MSSAEPPAAPTTSHSVGSPLAPAQRPRPRVSFSTYAMTVEAALRGEGVALGSLALLARPLAEGRLTRAAAPVWETGFGYFAGLPRDRAAGEPAQALAAALAAEAARTATERP